MKLILIIILLGINCLTQVSHKRKPVRDVRHCSAITYEVMPTGLLVQFNSQP